MIFIFKEFGEHWAPGVRNANALKQTRLICMLVCTATDVARKTPCQSDNQTRALNLTCDQSPRLLVPGWSKEYVQFLEFSFLLPLLSPSPLPPFCSFLSSSSPLTPILAPLVSLVSFPSPLLPFFPSK